MTKLASLVASTSALALVFVARSAFAEPTATTVEPAPGQAAAAAPSPSAVPITATCSLGDHPGIDDAEARTAADVLCHDLASRGATNTNHEVRFGRLGGKTLVTLASRNGNTYDERRTFVAGLDELVVAGPRLASALTENKSLEQTRDVDNVLAAETRQRKVQRGSMAFDAELFGVTAPGVTTASAGIDFGLAYRGGSFAVESHGRAGGIGSSKDKLSLATLDVGGRLYLSSGDFSPYIGAGVGLSYFDLNRASGRDLDGSGFGAYGIAGVEMLRTHHVAFNVGVRIDTPFYELQPENTYEAYAMNGTGMSEPAKAHYITPLSLNVGLIFH
jgi:opacity protein-like surface antigen